MRIRATVVGILILGINGCAATATPPWQNWPATLDAYGAACATRRQAPRVDGSGLAAWLVGTTPPHHVDAGPFTGRSDGAATSRPSTRHVAGYWCDSLAEQATAELSLFARQSFWDGFRVAFWDLSNATALAAAFGASLAIRETGVDATLAGRIRHHRQLGDFDEPIQLLGNPATHFAATGVLWLTSTLRHNQHQHELARTLARALAVTGFSTVVLKVSTNTSAPDGGRFAWPSGHTSSSFAVAAVLSEYYGPKVGIPAIALAGLVGYQRLDSRVHDFSDVVFGAVLGWTVGRSIARDDLASPPKLLGLQLVPYADPYTGVTGIALRRSW